MSTETPDTRPEPVAATPPTTENVAEMLTSGDNDYHDGNYWHPSISAQGNVVSIGITAYDDDGNKLPEVHFTAVVVEGETVPLVLERPDLSDGSSVYGRAFGETDYTEPPQGWHTFATNHVIYGGTGHISFAEARRFAAALVAVADAAEAAQAKGGDQ